jgi:hypothetical protein
MRLLILKEDQHLLDRFLTNPTSPDYVRFLADLVSLTYQVKVCLYKISVCNTSDLEVQFYANFNERQIHIFMIHQKDFFLPLEELRPENFERQEIERQILEENIIKSAHKIMDDDRCQISGLPTTGFEFGNLREDRVSHSGSYVITNKSAKLELSPYCEKSKNEYSIFKFGGVSRPADGKKRSSLVSHETMASSMNTEDNNSDSGDSMQMNGNIFWV